MAVEDGPLLPLFASAMVDEVDENKVAYKAERSEEAEQIEKVANPRREAVKTAEVKVGGKSLKV